MLMCDKKKVTVSSIAFVKGLFYKHYNLHLWDKHREKQKHQFQFRELFILDFREII